MTSTIDEYLQRWQLVPDGERIRTDSSELAPVLADGRPAMLKLALVDEERTGGRLMSWWNGHGAARVLRHDDSALLLERATGTRDLETLCRSGRDDDAALILCQAVATLHGALPEGAPPPLVPLERWFGDLFEHADEFGTLYQEAARHAHDLVRSTESVVLHGDIHHGNVLDFAERGWLAIDSKGLVGHRGFDYANILCNPSVEIALPRLEERVVIIARESGLTPDEVLRWCIAWSGLSACWFRLDGAADTANERLALLAEAMRLREKSHQHARDAGA